MAVHVNDLAITVGDAGARLSIHFDNNDRNVQLLLPLGFDLGCAEGAPCASACYLYTSATEVRGHLLGVSVCVL